MYNGAAQPLRYKFSGRAVRSDKPECALGIKVEISELGFTIRVAFARIARKTGSSSPGELLITCSTADVAVCCSSDCRSSLSSRAFSMAMTACAAKFLTSSICLSVKGGHLHYQE